MTAVEKKVARAAYWSVAGLIEGARLCAPVMPGMALFGAAFGALAAQKGLTLLQSMLMTAAVYAGASQFVALEMWSKAATVAGVISLGLVTATVNMLFVITDPGWLIAMHYHAKGGRDASILVGGGLAFWLIWIVSCLPGYLLGAQVADPKRFGL